MTETIVAAAVRIPTDPKWHGKLHNMKPMYPTSVVIMAPPPARHHTILQVMFEKHGNAKFEDQGFITSTGRYVEREEALQIAIASGQSIIDHPSRHAKWLFSEDLW